MKKLLITVALVLLALFVVQQYRWVITRLDILNCYASSVPSPEQYAKCQCVVTDEWDNPICDDLLVSPNFKMPE